MPRFNAPLPIIEIAKIDIKLRDMPDFEGFGEEFDTQFKKSIKKMAYEAKEFWQSEAGRRLKTSRESYQKALAVYESESGASVRLGGSGTKDQRWLAKAVETGIPSFDMKPGLLAGADRRIIPVTDRVSGQTKFRTVAKYGQDHKWVHPGITGIHLQDEVIKELNETIIPKYVEKAFDAAKKRFEKAKKKAAKVK
jgi:hypothetical protein